tara:strand:- start:327 stop:539 length:213 start_codon:yes stop_codon:yes gene_type:complete
MEIIIQDDGIFKLVEVTKHMLSDMKIYAKNINCFDLCDIIRLKLTTYMDYPFNQHVMIDGSGYFYGCICR